MPGRNTALRGPHGSRFGALAFVYVPTPVERARLLAAQPRRLTPAEAWSVCCAIGFCLDLRDQHRSESIARQDVLRTLEAIAAAAPAEAERLAFDCDAATEFELIRARHAAGRALPAEDVAQVALKAMRAVPGTAGRRAHWYQEETANRAVATWAMLNGANWSIRGKETYQPPLLRWGVAFLSIIEGRQFNRQKAEALLIRARNEFKGPTAGD